MKPHNLAERNRQLAVFIATYSVTLFLLGSLCYLLLNAVPREQRRLTAITDDHVEAFLRYTDQADTLVFRIQHANTLDPQKLLPLYQWVNDLKTVYHQPFYAVIADSYTHLVGDLTRGKAADTTAATLQDRIIAVQKENLRLKTELNELKTELQLAKKQNTAR